jgi:hypothetical protein
VVWSFFVWMCPQISSLFGRRQPWGTKPSGGAPDVSARTGGVVAYAISARNLERANDRFVEHDAARRPEEPCITEGEDAAISGHGPIATSVLGALIATIGLVELLTAH